MTAPITARHVLLAGSLILFLSLGARQGFGLFMLPAMVDMGMTPEQFSTAVATQYLAAAIRESSGSYDAMWLCCSVLCALGCAASLRIGTYMPRGLLSGPHQEQERGSA